MRAMKFTKMHGLGNDYVFVSAFDQDVPEPTSLARRISDRHRGIGSDGLIVMHPSKTCDVRMEMYNADGSRAQMCGNGLRCVAKYAIEHGLTAGPEVIVETDAGRLLAHCRFEGDRVVAVRADMGEPSLAAQWLPASTREPQLVEYPLDLGKDLVYAVTCVSTGNPHAVIFVENVQAVALERVGPLIERHRLFPARINVHFAQVEARHAISMRTWERGSGITQACGSGACAVCVAGVTTGRSERRVTITLPGGDLEIDWAEDNHVHMTGPAVEVFEGVWPEKTG